MEFKDITQALVFVFIILFTFINEIDRIMPPYPSIQKYVEIAKELWDSLEEMQTDRRLSIFLCGGASENQLFLREQVSDHLKQTLSKYSYRPHFPEHLFMDVMRGHHRVDLLGLESQLADSVHVIAILLHSPGTMTELGAFANHEKLRQKLIVFVDPRHRRRQSFIRLGPLRHLEKHGVGKVVYKKLENISADAIAEDIRIFARKISQIQELAPEYSLLNPVIAYEFYLSMIFLLTPIPDFVLRQIAERLHGSNDKGVTIIADAVISTLIRDALVRRSPIGLETTQQGQNELLNEYATHGLQLAQRKILNQLRSRTLSLLYRGRNRTIRGGAITWSTR